MAETVEAAGLTVRAASRAMSGPDQAMPPMAGHWHRAGWLEAERFATGALEPRAEGPAMPLDELMPVLSPMLRLLVAIEANGPSTIVLTQRGVVQEVLPADDPDNAARAALRLIDHHGSSVMAFVVDEPDPPPPPGERVHDRHLLRWLEIGISSG
jgi:hypothetical protein